MNKMKKLLSVLLAVVIALSCMSVMASAAKTSYKTVDELNALDAYSPYGQVTRLSLEERSSIVLDFLDNVLPGLNINMGTVFDVMGLSVTIDLTSVDRLCYSFDTIKSTFENGLASIAMAIVDLGILESLSTSKWTSGMSRNGTAQWTIISTIFNFLSDNTTLVGKVFSDGLDLGLVSLGDMSSIENIIMNLPGMIKGLIYPMLERWDDTLADVKTYDNNMAADGGVNSIANTRVKALFSDNMSITTVKYDVNGNMTSEHTGMPFQTSAPGTPSDTSPRCVYVMSAATPVPGTTLTVYHIVDAKEAEALAKDTDDSNNVAAYNYIAEDQTYIMAEEAGNGVYVWKAVDEKTGQPYAEGGSTLKWYNDDSALLPGFSGDDFDLLTMSAGDLLYTFMPKLFDELALVVLNGSVKKILAEFTGAKFEHIGKAGPEADDAVAALGSDDIFVGEQGDYAFEWSDYAVVGGVHYYRYLDDLYVADLSATNNYFDIINWNFEVTSDLLNKYIPADAHDVNTRLLTNLTAFLTDVANLVLLPSAETKDEGPLGIEATWTRPTFTDTTNASLINNIKTLAQAVVSLAPEHIFGDDYTTNPRCYYDMFMSSDNDTVLAGIAAQLVDIIMPSMTLPTADQLIAANTKVGAILAAVVREFAAQLTPQYNYDNLIYADFGTTEADPVKTFLANKDSEYWLDVILTMGIHIGYEYLRAFADMGEDNGACAGVASYGMKFDNHTFAESDLTVEYNGTTFKVWEVGLDYIIDWALEADYEWSWAFENIVNTTGLTVDLSTPQDPWVKLQTVLGSILPVDEILTVTPDDGEQKIEHWLKDDLILGIVDLKWDHLIDTLQFNGSVGYFRNDNVLNNLAALLKTVVNSIFAKVGGGSYSLIPSVITNFDELATQANLVTMIKNLVGVLYTALVTNGLGRTIMPFLNFLFGWKTDPQKIADPVMGYQFQGGKDYAFQGVTDAEHGKTGGGSSASTGTAISGTYITFLNNSAGMLETHRNSDVTDHNYDIVIKSVTFDGTINNDLSASYVTVAADGTESAADATVNPWEKVWVKVNGTYKGDEAVTMTIAYDYVGKDGQAVGGTQYTSYTFLISGLYEDADRIGTQDGDHDKDYTGIYDFKSYVFTEDLYTTVTTYEQQIHYVQASLSNPDKSFVSCLAEGQSVDCNGNVSGTGATPTAPASNYFAQYTGQAGGWAGSVTKDSSSTSAKLYYALDGVTADTEFAYGAYDMGGIGVKYGDDTKVWYVDFIYYNDYNVYDIYTENKDNGYNAYQGVASNLYEAYRTAWNKIVYLATYPMMTTARNIADWIGHTAAGTSANDYVTAIMPQIEPAIAEYEAAKEAYEEALADAQSSGAAGAALPQYVQNMAAEIENDFDAAGKEINFQDRAFYEYFNYQDVKAAGENLYRTFLAPKVMDTYYIQGSGISEAELDLVANAETSASKKAGILASRLENSADAIAASQVAYDEWKMPITSKLVVDDTTARIAYYKTFVIADSAKEDADLLYFLTQEVAHIDAQGLVEEDYESVTWGRFAEAYADAEAIIAGTDEFSNYNSRIFDVKWELMVAYKQLLKNDDSLIQAGGTADLLANIEIAEAIFASMDAADGAYLLKEGVDANEAYAALISALGYEYQARYSSNDDEVINGEKAAGDLKYNADGSPMMFELYADSAYEYANNDRPNKSGNQAKVNAANAKLEAAIANFEVAVAELPELGAVDGTTGAFSDTEEIDGIVTGYIYGVTAGDVVEDYFALVDDGAGYTKPVASTLSGGAENGTGAKVQVYNNSDVLVAEYTLIVFGDVNGDGSITAADYSAVKGYTMGVALEADEALIAADCVDATSVASSEVTASDYSAVKSSTMGVDLTVNPYIG